MKKSRSNAAPQPDTNRYRGPGRLISDSRFCILVLFLLTGVVFSPFLFSDTMLYGSDTFGNIDSRVFLKESLFRRGQLPMWFNSRLSGMPTIDALFGDILYVPSLLLHGLFPVHRALGLKLVLHVFLAGLFFFLLLYRGFRVSAPVACAGAALYMFNPQFFSHIYPGHDGKMFVIAWLPFIVWRMKELMNRPGTRNASLLALGVAMSLFTSHIQMTYFVLWGLFLYWLTILVMRWRESRSIRTLLPHAGYFWAGVLGGIGLAFIQIFPSFMFVRAAFSVRGVDRGFEYATSWSLHWPELLSLWVPEFGNWLSYYWSASRSFQGGNPFKLNTEYAGAVALLCAVLSIVNRPRPWRIFWAAVAGSAVIYAMGAHLPLFHIAYAVVPGVRRFRAPSMIMFWFSFGVVLLASLFLDDLFRGRVACRDETRGTKWKKGLLLAAAAVTAVALLFSLKGFVAALMRPLVDAPADSRGARLFDLNFEENFLPMLWLWWLITTGILIALWGVVAGKFSIPAVIAVIGLVGLLDCLRVDLGWFRNRGRQDAYFVKTVNPRPYFQSEPAIRRLQREMKKEPFRVFVLPGAMPQGGMGVHGLEQIGGFADNELRWYRAFRGDQSGANFFSGLLGQGPEGRPYLIARNMHAGNPFLNIANVRYYLSRQNGELVPVPNEGGLGRVSFARYHILMPPDSVPRALRRKTYDYRTTVALSDRPPGVPSPPPQEASGDTGSSRIPLRVSGVRWEAYTPNYRRLVLRSPADGMLRISEVWYPGWKVSIDGIDTPVYRADCAWMALPVSEGTHTVEMRVNSLYFGKALWVSALFAIAIGLYWGGALLRKRSYRNTSR